MGTLEYIGFSVYFLTIIGTIIVVICENRKPIRTLAWVLILVFMPVLGVILFYFFGQDNRKVKNIMSQYKRWSKILPANLLKPAYESSIPESYTSLATLLEHTNVSFVNEGSEVQVITNGEKKFDLLIRDIQQAKHHVHMQYFIFNNDETGKRVKKALMDKAREGVEVRFLYDNVANITVPNKFYNEMREAGVQVFPFMKIRFASFKSRVNYRNHRKVVVIDGLTGYIGGMNVGDDYVNEATWRDTHLRITGRGVYGLQTYFIMDWSTSDDRKIENESAYFPACDVRTKNLLQISGGGPNMQWENLLQATLQLVITSKKYLYIQTPYFLPTDSLNEALQVAALSGVDIRLMVSRKSDSAYLDPAAKSYYSGLLRAGLRIYELQTKFIHAKTMVADDYLSVIGSANMDFRSFETNFEINCYLYDAALAEQNKIIFFEDLKSCKEIVLEEWMKRSRWQKMCESVMRLFSPLL